MYVTLDAKRRLSVPAGVSAAGPDDILEVDFDPDEDVIAFRRITHDVDWLQVLSECPVPMDDLPRRRRESFRSKL